MKILVMKIKDINNYNSEKFIDSFKNIYEESKFITEHADKKRPFKNKKEMILIFLELFDNLDEETKINITGQDIKLSGFTQSKIDPIMDNNMMIPPMVGVPFLAII